MLETCLFVCSVFWMVAIYLRQAQGSVIPWQGIDPESVEMRSKNEVVWTDCHGNAASPPNYDSLPDPAAVLRGEIVPDLDLIRFKSSETFVAGG
jgi:hypothetical protein